MFKTPITLALISLAAGLVAASAQTAEDYFHGSVRHYVYERKEEAKATLSDGLAKFPSDPKLNAMAGLLKDEEQKQQQDQKNQQQEQQEQKDKQDKQDKSQQQQKQDGEKPNSQKGKDQKDQPGKEPQPAEDPKDQDGKKDPKDKDKDKGQQGQKPDDKKQPQPQPNPGKPGESQEGRPQDGAGSEAAQAGMLTPQQARQILDAQKSDEKMLPVDLQKAEPKSGGPRRFKDW